MTCERQAVSRPAGRGGRAASAPSWRGHVVDDAVVGGCRAAEHRELLGQPVDHPAEAPVVGAEVVTPVGDAVRLVDHDQTRSAPDERHHLVAELRVGEPLGRDEQQVDLVALQQVDDLADLGVGGGVDRCARSPTEPPPRSGCASARAAARSAASGPPASRQQSRGQEVDGALAPPGALHEQHPLASDSESLDRLPLAITERDAGSPGEPLECPVKIVYHLVRVRVGATPVAGALLPTM